MKSNRQPIPPPKLSKNKKDCGPVKAERLYHRMEKDDKKRQEVLEKEKEHQLM